MSIYRPQEIAKACNFSKSNTPSWVFLTFFKLYKCYQIAQCITFTMFTYNRYLTRLCHPTEYLISPNLQLCGSNASVGNSYFTLFHLSNKENVCSYCVPQTGNICNLLFSLRQNKHSLEVPLVTF